MTASTLQSLRKYGIKLIELAQDEEQLQNFMRMENWLSDRPSHTAASIRQWLKDFYIDNKLATGELMLGDSRVDLKQVACPVLNIYGEHDVIAPPICTQALGKLVGTRDYTEISFPGGHIGVFVGKRAQNELASAMGNWLRERSQ